eukprot:364271-Chlamydomonas_euryale.AAC.7
MGIGRGKGARVLQDESCRAGMRQATPPTPQLPTNTSNRPRGARGACAARPAVEARQAHARHAWSRGDWRRAAGGVAYHELCMPCPGLPSGRMACPGLSASRQPVHWLRT